MTGWEVKFNQGVFLPQIDWWLDAHRPVARSFVSHAHFDHLATHREVLCSELTARLMRARLPAGRVEHVLPFGHTEALSGDTTVTLHPAGHILGSAMSLLAHDERGSLLYTGDFKLRRGRSAEACATPRADTLIMETTYGRSHYVMPPTEEVLARIVAFCRETLEDGGIPVLFGYSLGKSQELLSSLSEASLPVMLHPQAAKLTRIYEEAGVHFPPYREFDPADPAGHVVISPPQGPNSGFLRKIPRRRTAAITGWALDPGVTFRYQCDAAFPLSDHADFTDLLRFVEAVQPQRVLTLHGFAADFARTLRDRGIEAWALGQDNQLEMPLRAAPPLPPKASTPSPSRSAPEAAQPEAFARFASTASVVGAAGGRLQKVAALAGYLADLSADNAAQAALLLTGRPFPQTDERTLNLGWAVIKRAILELTGLNEADWRQAYLRFGDSGEAAEAVLAGHVAPQAASLADVAAFFERTAALRGPVEKIAALRERLRTLTPLEAKFLLKIVTGDLRIGLKEGLVEEAVAAAWNQPPAEVRDAHLRCGDLPSVVRAAKAGELASLAPAVFRPLQFMLASPEPTAEAILERLGAPVWLEEKYDGIRCQLHKQGERVELYSRELRRITGQFPELARAAQALPGDLMADGELLAWRDGRALPFADLQKRLGRTGGDDFFLGAEIPVSLSLYDLLWINGEPLVASPLAERRERLECFMAGRPSELATTILLAPVQRVETAPEIEAAFAHARRRGNEGLMAKDPRSPYSPGRRGLAWLKLKKAYATLDVVVTGVEYGHGKRRGVLSDYTFSVRDDAGRLFTVGKAYSGLTDAEIAELTGHFLDRTLEEKGRYRRVVPDVVLEVAFDSLQASDRHESGFALRFPRIVRIRTDKAPAEIDTLETCRRLAGGNSFAPPAV